MLALSKAVRQPVLILVAHERDVPQLRQKIENISIPGWENYISLRGWTPRHVEFADYTDQIIDDFLDFNAKRIFHMKGTLSVAQLEESEIAHRAFSSINTLFKEVSTELKNLKLHWVFPATHEWEKSSIRCAHPEEWLRQFVDIGHKQIGINILKSLRVFTSDELTNAFQLSKSEEIGLKVAHAYIAEDEPGSSSISVQNILEHMHPEGAVIALDLSKDDMLTGIECDVLYVYEDGLWSGVELVKRLRRIIELVGFQESNLHVVFKYCVTCDAGLSAARLFTLQHAVGRFTFPSAPEHLHFDFFCSGTDSRFSELADRSWQSVRAAVDAAVQPYAFANRKIWQNGNEEAIRVCAEIGSQLLAARLERDSKDDTEVQAKVERMKLGAMGFASTMVFEYSVPKPVLPAMWLDGDVLVDGTKVSWKPLFWDARRTGKVEHHLNRS
ncbi:phosphoribosyltransferase-like protein [Stutzerimonas stutzeri]|uniref:phosphoribosyltransferase-like protein n=1 Tax=Stutzerimonas stutzeri TaxID=316 RepID=UPI0015E3A3C2|nr:hypothetical protein [Stutzerimonas stutzeri]MBA1279934.1 hypothetical protein [Stutzerimonas stutzeri]